MRCGQQCRRHVMNWIGVLADKKTERLEDTPYDEVLFGVVSDRGAALDCLEVLAEQRVLGFQLAGTNSTGTAKASAFWRVLIRKTQCGPMNSMVQLSCQTRSSSMAIQELRLEDQWHLKEAIDRRISDLKSLGLKGRIHCHEALEICAKTNSNHLGWMPRTMTLSARENFPQSFEQT